eukprot:COSAG01_NODE_1346_length_10632_cov_6.413842_1_plen_475_part_00
MRNKVHSQLMQQLRHAEWWLPPAGARELYREFKEGLMHDATLVRPGPGGATNFDPLPGQAYISAHDLCELHRHVCRQLGRSTVPLTFDDLPDTIVTDHVMQYLDPASLASAARVCKLWQRMADASWEGACRRHMALGAFLATLPSPVQNDDSGSPFKTLMHHWEVSQADMVDDLLHEHKWDELESSTQSSGPIMERPRVSTAALRRRTPSKYAPTRREDMVACVEWYQSDASNIHVWHPKLGQRDCCGRCVCSVVVGSDSLLCEVPFAHAYISDNVLSDLAVRVMVVNVINGRSLPCIMSWAPHDRKEDGWWEDRSEGLSGTHDHEMVVHQSEFLDAATPAVPVYIDSAWRDHIDSKLKRNNAPFVSAFEYVHKSMMQSWSAPDVRGLIGPYLRHSVCYGLDISAVCTRAEAADSESEDDDFESNFDVLVHRLLIGVHVCFSTHHLRPDQYGSMEKLPLDQKDWFLDWQAAEWC